MTGKIQMICNPWICGTGEKPSGQAGEENAPAAAAFGPEIAGDARTFHKSMPGYKETPLVSLQALASRMGVESVHIKDESFRFGLNAFKVLGGSYGIARFLGEIMNVDISEMTYEKLTGPEMQKILLSRDGCFVTATDGNHGLGVAWMAQQMGLPCYVYMPKGSSYERLLKIRQMGAHAEIIDGNYEAAVARAAEFAGEFGAQLIQDTVLGMRYTKIPRWIMEGYTTMADEAYEQLFGEMPTHIFLQAGVGSMAGAVAGYFTSQAASQGVKKPVITVVEPDKADCYFRTVKDGDGRMRTVYGEMDSIMAGLCCGEPCRLGWDVLRECAEFYASIPDEIAAKGMRVLGNPLPPDERVISGESGAAGAGFLAEVLLNPDYSGYRDTLGLDSGSRILLFSTEGATDRENYRKIVWDGLFPSY